MVRHRRHFEALALAALLSVAPAFAAAEPIEPAPAGTPQSAPAAGADGVSGASVSLFPVRPLKLGIIGLTPGSDYSPILENTVAALRKAFAPYEIEVQYAVKSEKLEAEIRAGTIDAFIASSGFYWRLIPSGATRIGSLITPRKPNPNRGIAATILVRADRSDLKTLSDLKGTRLSASYESAFMSYRTGMAEIAAAGYDPDRFFKRTIYQGDTDNSAIAARVLSGEADAAMVRACWLEDQPMSLQRQFRVIHPVEGDIACAHSTRAYPTLIFGMTKGAPPGAAQIITQTIMAPDAVWNGSRWGMATDITSVDRLQRELKIESYAYLREWTVKRWFERYWPLAAAAVLLVLGILFYNVMLGRQVRERTAELSASIEKERRMRAEMDELNERNDHMSRVLVVGQLSSMIAHELTQPLAAIGYYNDGVKRLIARKDCSPEALRIPALGVDHALDKIREILDRVRSYVSGSAKRDGVTDYGTLVAQAIASINQELFSGVQFEKSVAGTVRGDRVEMVILLRNLLKNALEAAHAGPAPRTVRLETSSEGASSFVKIVNSGRVLSEKEAERLRVPLFSSKKESGHGLGLGIVMSIAEASGGNIRFTPRPEGGLAVDVALRSGMEEKRENT
jgi:two-component system, LuxR family, sensor histidine kinase TtrS